MRNFIRRLMEYFFPGEWSMADEAFRRYKQEDNGWRNDA